MHSTSSRRTFVSSPAAGGAFRRTLGLWRQPVWALTSPGQPTVLSGSQFDLTIDSMSVDSRPPAHRHGHQWQHSRPAAALARG